MSTNYCSVILYNKYYNSMRYTRLHMNNIPFVPFIQYTPRL